MTGLTLGIDAPTLAVIIGMALATYACRAGGYWLFRQIRPTPFMRTLLGYVPGTLFAAYVVPALVRGGLQQWVGAAAAVAAMLAMRSLSAAIFAGTAAAWAVWQFG
ncbi:MAG TPA: AzlD domain-containing protein [Stellaceae bacterium]|nr:AzlD domain-containing protein [Stellaceae bacterium]